MSSRLPRVTPRPKEPIRTARPRKRQGGHIVSGDGLRAIGQVAQKVGIHPTLEISRG